MTSVTGLLSAVTKLVPFGNVVEPSEERDVGRSLLLEDEAENHVYETDRSDSTPLRSSDAQPSPFGPDNSLGLREPARADSPLTAPVRALHRSKPSANTGASLLPPRPSGRRSFSVSHIEKGSSVPDPQQLQKRRTGPSDVEFVNDMKIKQEQGEHSTGQATTKDGCTRYLEEDYLTCSMSNPDLQTNRKAYHNPGSTPMERCLKRQAESVGATAVKETTALLWFPLQDQKLRRRKTLDFVEQVSESTKHMRISNSAAGLRRHRLGKVPKQAVVCPGTAMLSRRSLASTAITRTDVHVIAISSSSSQSVVDQAQPAKVRKDSATPTMQIVESSSGSYEVVWDDVPPERTVREQRRSSSAGQALEAMSTRSKGLERVNTKLTEWSGIWNTPSNRFKPSIVVFPDDDGVRPDLPCAVVDDEDIEVFAPPNSERASAVHSRRASRPASTSITRAHSQDDFPVASFTQEILSSHPSPTVEVSRSASDPEAWPVDRLAAHQRPGVPPSDRRLSNIDEIDIRFRDHRDSVTLAHSRLIKSGGVRPELFAHRDSVTLAKKRMHARNHRASNSQRLHRLQSKSEPGPLPDDNAAIVAPLPAVESHTPDEVRDATRASILRRTKVEGKNHIRIEV